MQMNRCTKCMEEIGQDVKVCPHCGYEQNEDDQPSNALRKDTILAGRYLVGNVIGQGGFGITYVGYDLRLDMKVAVKEYFPTGAATRAAGRTDGVQWNLAADARQEWENGMERFFKEARRMAKLDSVPAIVRVRDVFRENETAYIVMDFVEGVTLKSHLLKNGALRYGECVRLLSPIFDSLAVMHGHGFIHRDISPDNIMLQPDGTVRLLDMGAAVDVNAGGGHVSMAVVRRYFSAPEQYVESETVGSWTDVYAMAATIYYCLTGKLPPEAIEREFKKKPLDFDAGYRIPPQGIAALSAALELDAGKRTKTMQELKEGLEQKDGAGMPEEGKRQEEQEASSGKPEEEQEKGIDTHPAKKPDKKLIAVLAVCAAGAVCFGIGLASRLGQVEPGVLMADPFDGDWDNWGTVLGSGYTRDEIITVTFLDTLEDPGSNAWDVSADKSGEVMAWTEPDGEYYDLYIAGENGVSASNCNRLFGGYIHVTEINFNKAFDTGNVTDMECMFSRCSSLTSIDVSGFDIGNVNNISYMFSDCSSLTSIDVSGFDTGNLKNMEAMFSGCSSLSSIDVSGFDTGNVKNMSGMFSFCSSLTSIDVSGFDTGNVTDMGGMFSGCSSLSSIDVSGFDTGNVTEMEMMFYGCSSLSSIDVSGFDTGNVKNMSSMFSFCSSLSSIDVSGFDTGNVTDMYAMFHGCSSLNLSDDMFDRFR